MVFQRPNPFPKSIYDNVAFGPRITGRRKGLDDIVEEALVNAALWDEVKGKLIAELFEKLTSATLLAERPARPAAPPKAPRKPRASAPPPPPVARSVTNSLR